MIPGPNTPIWSLLGSFPTLVEISVSQNDVFPSVPKLPLPAPTLHFPIPRRPSPSKCRRDYFYQITTACSIITFPTPPRLHLPLRNIGPSLSMPLVTKGGRRRPQSANRYVLRHSFEAQLNRSLVYLLVCLLACSLARPSHLGFAC